MMEDSGEYEDGFQVAPVACQGYGDYGLRLFYSFVFLRGLGFGGGFLSLLRSWIFFGFCPTACAVGCTLSPLCGWGSRCVCGFAFFGLPPLWLGAWLGLLVGARILLWPRGRGRPRHTCLLRLRLRHGRSALGRIRGVRSDIGGRS